MAKVRSRGAKPTSSLIKGDTMIDANVLIYSLKSHAFTRAAPAEVRDMILASKSLLMAMPVVRIPAEVLVALDAIVERRAAAMAPQGGTTSRNAIIVTALREFIERDAAGGVS